MSTAPIVGVISGKGGVGKTNVVANLAVAAARRGSKVLAVDGDLGLASLDVLLGLRCERTVADVLDGRCELEQALVKSPLGIDLLPAAPGRSDLAALGPRGLARLLVPLFEASRAYDLVLLDAASGVSPGVVSLALACDRLLLVSTPEPTSLADAYASLKVLARERPRLGVELLVNLARGEREAREAHERLRKVTRRFLDLDPPLIGCLSRDARVPEAVRLQQPVIQAFPLARWSRELRALSLALRRPPRWAPAETAQSRASEG